MSTFKNYSGASAVAGASVYTVPANTTGVIIGFHIANVSGSNENVSVDINGVYLIKDAVVPAGSTLSVIDGKVIVEQNSVVKVTSTTAGGTHATVSVLEQ